MSARMSRSENTAKEAMEDALKPMTRAYYEVLRGLSRRGHPVFEEGTFHVPAHARGLLAPLDAARAGGLRERLKQRLKK